MALTMNRWQRFQHGFLNWHPLSDRVPVEWDGASMHVRCKVCGITGMEDSQGNIF